MRAINRKKVIEELKIPHFGDYPSMIAMGEGQKS
jgi:hypothetical protein